MRRTLRSILMIVMVLVTLAMLAVPALAAGSTVSITKQPKAVAAPKDATAKVTFTASGDGLKYQWYFKDKGKTKFIPTATFSGNTYTAVMNATRNGRQIYCVVKDKYGNSVKTNTVTLRMGNPAKITAQPKTGVAPKGATAKVTFTASGDGLKYQWYFKDKGETTFIPTSTFTGNSYTAEMNAARNGRQVYCVVTDKYGTSVKTNTVTLTMGNPAKITRQPKSVSAANGATATVTVGATGDGLKYQWYYKERGGSAFALTKTFTGSGYTVQMNNTRRGRQVYCVITDKYGTSVKTNTVTLNMTGVAKITAQPKSATAANGATAKISFTASGDGLKYQWYFKDRGATKFIPTATFSGNTYTAVLNATRHGRQIYCVVTDKYGNTAKTNTVTLNMTGAAKITAQPKSATAANGATAKVSFTASGDGLKYQWYFKDKDKTVFIPTTTFSGNTYTAAMNATRHGRQIYCVVTDKYGTSVKTETVTLNLSGAAKITAQPKTVSVANGATAKVSFTASGEGLKYQWYFKDKGTSVFVPTTTFTGNSYTAAMNVARHGRQIYCVVTDKYGMTVKTNTVTLNMTGAVKLTRQPVSVRVDSGVNAAVSVGATGHGLTYKWYYKNKGASSFTYTGTFTGNSYSAKMDGSRDGRQIYCVITDKYGNSVKTNTVTLYMKSVYYITANVGKGDPVKIGVGIDGKYSLPNPSVPGYTFKGWRDSKGNTIKSSGTVYGDTKVYSVWSPDGTDSLKELKDRVNAGYSCIKITANITVSEPIYISYNTTIYSDGNYTIKRAANYAGDIFVVGRDKNGVSATLHHREAVLTLGGSKGTLTIDGNRDGVKVKVVGSAVFCADGATVNIRDGARIANNKKLGNKRVLDHLDVATEDSIRKAGGAAILNVNGTINMYGGVIENNLVHTAYTTVKDETGKDVTKEYDGCGGAIYNRGKLNMYGGTIRNSEALRGGGVYNDRVVYLFAGTISGNKAHTYGGGLSTSSSMNADTFVGDDAPGGTMLFSNNYSMRAGGAMYSNTNSPIVILGNASFVGNRTDSSGGAIYTAGTLTIRNATFKGNDSEYSGGAIYHHYTKADFSRRHLEVTDCVFEENTSGLGGAITLSRTTGEDTKGTRAVITGSRFLKNQAVKTSVNPGNGGAIYITQFSDVYIQKCEFTENTAVGVSGAVSVHSQANLQLTDSSFTGNTAAEGGAMYLSSQSNTTMANLTFAQNQARKKDNGSGGNGGAVCVSGANISVKGLTVQDNAAENNGGGIYLNATTLTLDKTCTMEGNTAESHGGAVYLTYTKNSDGTKTGSVLTAKEAVFHGNRALAGGAVSIRTDCSATLNKATLTQNVATSTGEESYGGGAVYVGFGKLTLKNVIASGNTSAGIGGVVASVASPVEVTGGKYENNSAASGGAFQIVSESTMNVTGSVFMGNAATATEVDGKIGGGAINAAGSTLNLSGVTMNGNTTGYYGGAVLARKATVRINGDSVITGSAGATGAALYFRENTEATLENVSITDNTSSANGVVYINGGKLDMVNITATGNEALSGGVLYTSGAATQVTLKDSTWSGNSANNGGAIYMSEATVIVHNTVMEDNTAQLGGAIYNKLGNLITEKTAFTGNAANKSSSGSNGNGGAVCLVGGQYKISETDSFTENSAQGHAGAIYVSYALNEDNSKTPSAVTIPAITFKDNTAEAGGAISIRTDCEAILNGTILTGNSATYTGEDTIGGGAIYVGFGKLTLNNVVASGNTSAGIGGVVDAVVATVEVTGGKFENNSAATGGAFQIVSDSTATFTDTVFTGNASTATESDGKIGGGAINIAGSALTLTGITMENNTTGYYGAAVLARKATVSITDCTVSGSAGATGAALYFRENTEATLENVSITDNTSSANGVVYINGGKLDMVNVTATGNEALSGGVLFTSGASTQVTLKDSTWSGNSANNGGAIHMTDAAVTVENCTMQENTAQLGGAVYNKLGSLITEKVTFTGNAAVKSASGSNGNGGAICLVGAQYSVSETDTFTENRAEGHAGAIYVTYAQNEDNSRTPATLTVPAITFMNNTAEAGGAISIRTDCEATLNGTTFTGNSATYTGEEPVGGGAVYVGFGKLTMNDVIASGNTSAEIGGVVDAVDSTLEVTGGKFEANSAVTGGAFRITGGTEATVTDTVFTGNTASDGGALYVSSASTKVTLKNTIWTGNSANVGGAVHISRAAVTVNGGTLEKNTANLGGGIYNRLGSLTVENVTFKENTATRDSGGSNGNGGAISVSGGTVTGTGANLFEANSAENHAGAVYVSYAADNGSNVGGIANITDGVFKNNTAVAGGAVSARTGCEAIMKNTLFTGNSATGTESSTGGGAVYVGYGTLTLTGVTMENNSTAYYGGAVSAQGATVTVNGNTQIKNNTGVTGTALYFRDGGTATLENISVTDNASTSGSGVIYITGAGKLNITGLTATGNQNNNGGVIYASGTASVTLDKSALTGNAALSNGGAIDFRSAGKLTVTETTFSKNSAKLGGVIYTNAEKGQLVLTDNTFTENTANNGGVIFMEKASVTVTSGSMEKNTASLGGAICNRLGSLSVENVSFKENTSSGNGGAISVAGGTVTGTGTNLFEANSAEKHGGALYVSYTTENEKNVYGTAELTGGKFLNNTAMGGGAVSIRTNCTGKFDSAEFVTNTATGHADEDDGDGEGGGAIYAGYGTLILKDVTGTGNTTDNFGGMVNAVKSTVTVTGGSFTENSARAGGAFYGHKGAKITITDAVVSENESTYENTDYNNQMGGGAVASIGGELTLSGVTLDANKADYYGGTVLASGAVVTIEKGSVISKSVGKTGSALYFRDGSQVTMKDSSMLNNADAGNGVTYANGGKLEMENVTATGNTAGSGGVLFASGGATQVTVKNSAWTGNTAKYGGTIYIESASVSVIGGTMENNTSDLGGAIYNKQGVLQLTDATFKGNTAKKDADGNNGNGGAISVAGGTVTGTGTNLFESNSADNHGGAVYVSYITTDKETDKEKTYYGTIDLIDGTFKNNTAVAGGAVSARSGCGAIMKNTLFTGNSATGTDSSTGGGAVYVGYGSLTLTGVTMENNTTGYYGAAVSAPGTDVTINGKAQIKNNTGITGTALYFRDGGAVTLDDISVTDNVSTKGSGIIYITGNGKLNITGLTATGNQNNNGGVIYASGTASVTLDKSTLTGNTALSNGGAIDFRSTGKLTVTETVFSQNSAKLGGAIYTNQKVTLSKCELTGNTATEKGGAIYATDTTAAVTVENSSQLNTNTAPVGGAIYMDLGATVTVNGSTLDGNQSTTGDGGAIYVADSTKTDPKAKTQLIMTGATLQNNSSAARGGALATDTVSPGLIITANGCTFYNNSSKTSGGAVAIQNGNCNSATDPTAVPLVFKDCIFRANTATTDGGAIDIRTNSCAKLDGITAEDNKATGNAGVVYVTSNYSRLYITGTVTTRNNTARSGNFSYLYNNNYSNPPKIFTTHDSNASWYADVKGNSTNVVFDLTTLP